MDEYISSNRELWNNWTNLHVASESYDVEGFKAGKKSLHPLELDEMGDVVGKTLLHLQCHFGKDTLSWARLGAIATGADFSDKGINYARGLSAEIGVPSTFVLSDILDLPDALEGQFDIVYTSYGAIYWLYDLKRWGEVIGHFLKPGGTFYIAEIHPTAYMFENTNEDTQLKLTYPYFNSGAPLRLETQGSYAAPDADYQGVEYGWPHSMGEIVNALISAGLRIEYLHEFPFTVYPMFKGMEEGEDGYYRFSNQEADVPLLFTIKARKE